MPRSQSQKFAFTPYVTSLAVKLMLKILKRPCAQPFIDFFPDLDISNFRNIEPISISIIIQRLKTYDYMYLKEWESDMKQIPQNCVILFGPKDPTTLLANQLYSVFMKEYELFGCFNKSKWTKLVGFLTHKIMFKMLQRPPSLVQVVSAINSTLTQNYPFIFIPSENGNITEQNVVHNDLNSYYNFIQNTNTNSQEPKNNEIILDPHNLAINQNNISLIPPDTKSTVIERNIIKPIQNDSANTKLLNNHILSDQNLIEDSICNSKEIRYSDQEKVTYTENNNEIEKFKKNNENNSEFLRDENANINKISENSIESNNNTYASTNQAKEKNISNTKSEENISNISTNSQQIKEEKDEITKFLINFSKLHTKEDIISISLIIQEEQPELKLIGPNPAIEFESLSKNTLERLMEFTRNRV